MGKGEAEAVVRILLEGLGLFQFVTDELVLNDLQREKLEEAVVRLESGEPLQYVLGKAHFMGMDLDVNRNVLIPRPETEELVDWILKTEPQSGQSVLDLCTGSGCIALALRKLGNWKSLAGLDISTSALEVAAHNSNAHGLDINWIEDDLLKMRTLPGSWDVIVSNPPYVLPEESHQMSRGVLEFEPSLALFTSSSILFYERIGLLSAKSLNPGGSLYFELNPLTCQDVKIMLESIGFEQIEIKKDMQRKDRMMRARKRN